MMSADIKPDTEDYLAVIQKCGPSLAASPADHYRLAVEHKFLRLAEQERRDDERDNELTKWRRGRST
jgi:hypothetical protein